MTIKLKAIAIQDWSEIYDLANTYCQQEQWQAAAIALQRTIELRPDFFWSHHHLGDVLSRLQQWDRAIASYLQGIYLQPEHQLSYQKLGTAFKQGDLAQTIKDYRQLIQTPPQNSIFELLHNQPQRLIELANNLVQQHQTYGAIVVHYLVLEIQPTNIDVLQSLSQLLKQQSKLEQAIAVNQQQLQQNTDQDKPLKVFSKARDVRSALLSQPTTTPLPNQLKPIPGRILVQSNGAIPPDQLNDLCKAVGWSDRSLSKLEKAIQASFRHVGGRAPRR